MRAEVRLAPLVVILLLGLDFVATIDLPRSGQTKCYNEAGTEITCAGTGQDGDIRAGISLPSPRFNDNGDGTVTDNLTGLMWLKNANCADTVGYDPDGTGTGQVFWVNALAFVAGINDGTYAACQAGHTDWRLPNINELASLTTYLNLAPALPTGHPFTNIGGGWNYWSSTSNPSNGAYTVSLYSGNPGSFAKVWEHYVWPVRRVASGPYQPGRTGQTKCYDGSGSEIACAGTGQDGETQYGVAWPSPRFEDYGADMISDRLTGLIWLKDLNCADTIGYDPDATGNGTVTWQHALDFVNGVNSGAYPGCGAGKQDWRLPNAVEMISLASLSDTSPPNLLSGAGFTNLLSDWTWSSMTYSGSPTQESLDHAHAMHTNNGNWASEPKTNKNPIWLVRNGPQLKYFVADAQ